MAGGGYRTIMGPSKMRAFNDGIMRKEGQRGWRSYRTIMVISKRRAFNDGLARKKRASVADGVTGP